MKKFNLSMINPPSIHTSENQSSILYLTKQNLRIMYEKKRHAALLLAYTSLGVRCLPLPRLPAAAQGKPARDWENPGGEIRKARTGAGEDMDSVRRSRSKGRRAGAGQSGTSRLRWRKTPHERDSPLSNRTHEHTNTADADEQRTAPAHQEFLWSGSLVYSFFSFRFSFSFSLSCFLLLFPFFIFYFLNFYVHFLFYFPSKFSLISVFLFLFFYFLFTIL